jgi:mannose-6-phosphate isomerase-like protein (cupin superfamily)
LAGPNTAVFCPPGVFHGIRNAGETPVRYMIIRTA